MVYGVRATGTGQRHADDGSTGQLTGWPGHVASAEYVEVEMIDCLAAVLSRVGDHTVSALLQAFRLRYGRSKREKTSQHRGVRRSRERCDVLFRNREDVSGRLRVDIPEGDLSLSLRNESRGDPATRDLAEQAIFGHRGFQLRRCQTEVSAATFPSIARAIARPAMPAVSNRSVVDPIETG